MSRKTAAGSHVVCRDVCRLRLRATRCLTRPTPRSPIPRRGPVSASGSSGVASRSGSEATAGGPSSCAGCSRSCSSASPSCCLIFLSWLLRGAGLWGDLAFAIVVTTGVFLLARLSARRWLDDKPRRGILPRVLHHDLRACGRSGRLGHAPGGHRRCSSSRSSSGRGSEIAGRLWGPRWWMPVFWQAEVAGVPAARDRAPALRRRLAPSIGGPDKGAGGGPRPTGRMRPSPSGSAR